METGVLEDLLMHDTHTMPGPTDPAVEAKQRAAVEKYQKEQKQLEAEMKKQATKAAPKAAAAKKAAAAPTPEASQRKRDLKLHKIRLYFGKLRHKLTIKEPKTMPTTDEGIDELLGAIEVELSSNGGIEQAGLLYLNGVVAFERLTEQFNPLGLMLSGPQVSLSAAVAANKKQWEDVLTEFAIANADWFVVGPTKRLLFITVQLVQAVSEANKAAIAKARTAPPSEDLKGKAEDL